ncbi:MAG: hypothetical protein ACK4MX_05090 [Thermaurantiacus sp.]
MTHLLPRLPGPACDEIVRSFLEHGPSGWVGFRPNDLPDQVRYAATGGAPVPAASLAALREDLVDIAQKHGFGQDGGRQSHAGFDAETAAWLAQSDLFRGGEALRDDVWAFVAAVVAPDIVHWRFGRSPERYCGGVRNTFQRLWMRGRALDRGAGHPERWRLLEELTEDALVQITERPSIGGDPVLAVAVAEAWLRAARHHGKTAMEDIMRRAILRIRIRNEIRSLADLPPGDLANFIDGVFGVPEASISEAEPPLPEVSVAEAARNVRQEAGRRSWLSPKSQSALDNLVAGHAALDRGERNALDYLLGRLSEAGVLVQDIAELRAELSADLASTASSDSGPERPRRRSWAIWRAR